MVYSKVVENFLRYVKIDTQSSEACTDKVPSTEKQHNLAKMLYQELSDMFLECAYHTEHCYIYAVIPSNIQGEVPAIGFIAHMDTSDAVSGSNVQPRIIEQYHGEDIVLNEEKQIVTRVTDFPCLKNYTGKSLIVTDGNTLLGADDKAGVAEIMALAEFLVSHPDFKHGKIYIGFTPDEEVGNGVEFFDRKEFKADYAYTIDGGKLGEMSYECFNAASAKITAAGKSVHPGTAKNIMRNAMKMLYEFHAQIPNECPENTEGYQGFYHLTDMQGTVDKAAAEYIIRDHDRQKFEERKELFRRTVDNLNQKYGENVFRLELKDSYYNMREIIEKEMHIVDNAVEAMKQAGVVPQIEPIRGGTDGARLSFAGLPCPNVCTGSEAHHGRHEFACIEDMETVVEILKNLVKIYANSNAL